MSCKLKKVLKIICILLIILFLGVVFYRYQKLKSEGKLEEIFARKTNNSVQEDITQVQRLNENSKESSNEINAEDENNNGIENDYNYTANSYDYNNLNFDNVLLLYEGEQDASSTLEALNILIKDADDPMYTKPTVIFKNFDGLTNNAITVNDLDEYKKILNEAKALLDNSTYVFSFEYTKLNSRVNKIIITQN